MFDWLGALIVWILGFLVVVLLVLVNVFMFGDKYLEMGFLG